MPSTLTTPAAAVHPTLAPAAAALIALATAAACVSGCTGTVTGTPTPVTAAVTGTSTASPPVGDDLGGDVDLDVEIGDCVSLSGTVTAARDDTAPCGSPTSNYVVIGKAPTGEQCISDADQYYYETLFGSEQGALCLDIDWIQGACMDLTDANPVRVDCTTPRANTMRMTTILPTVADVDACPDPATYGFEKYERTFTVCTEQL